MWSVDDGLGVGEVMQGGEHSVFEAEGFVDHFDDWRDAISGAGGVGDDVIGGGVVELIVAAHNDVEDTFFDGGSDDDFFDAGVEVGLQAFGVAEGSGAFEDDVDARPVDFGRMVLGGVGESMAVDEDAVVGEGNIAIPAAVDGVEFEEVGGGFGVGLGVVESDEFELGIVEGGAKDEATDAAKSVDSDFHGRFMIIGVREGKRRSVKFFERMSHGGSEYEWDNFSMIDQTNRAVKTRRCQSGGSGELGDGLQGKRVDELEVVNGEIS